ncbi:hypothetical protein LINGRAHAP2_LOCUS21554 [Linum grandiflorum]
MKDPSCALLAAATGTSTGGKLKPMKSSVSTLPLTTTPLALAAVRTKNPTKSKPYIYKIILLFETPSLLVYIYI